MKQRQAVTAVTVQRYRNGSKKVKRQILDEFCETTGYSRGYGWQSREEELLRATNSLSTSAGLH